jgi:hypothetical protein
MRELSKLDIEIIESSLLELPCQVLEGVLKYMPVALGTGQGEVIEYLTAACQEEDVAEPVQIRRRT